MKKYDFTDTLFKSSQNFELWAFGIKQISQTDRHAWVSRDQLFLVSVINRGKWIFSSYKPELVLFSCNNHRISHSAKVLKEFKDQELIINLHYKVVRELYCVTRVIFIKTPTSPLPNKTNKKFFLFPLTFWKIHILFDLPDL